MLCSFERKGCGSTQGQQELATACERVWERKSCAGVAAVRSGQRLWLGCGAGARAYASLMHMHMHMRRAFECGANTQQPRANTRTNIAVAHVLAR